MMLVAPLGTQLRLTQDWTFTLKHEGRNSALHKALNTPEREWDMATRRYTTPDPIITLPAGTVLKLDRIYVRKGVGDYDSLTFYLNPKAPKGVTKGRFFAALSDCNNMEYELI